MSIFTEQEAGYLQNQTMGRLATVGRDGQPHVIPLTYHYNPEEQSIDLGGIDFAAGKKWRDVLQNRKVTFLIDDASPQGAHAIEIRAEAEVHESGGSKINPRFPNFVEQFIRLRPRYVVSWGINDPSGFKPHGRKVKQA